MASASGQYTAPAAGRLPKLGDARRGKLSANLSAFGRTLRRAGVPVDTSRIILAQQALQTVGVRHKADMSAALEAVLVSREEDRGVFRELFNAFFRDPELGRKLLSQLMPDTESAGPPAAERPRVRQAMKPSVAPSQTPKDAEVDLDAAMTASELERLRAADFNQLTASEYRLVERLVRDIPLALPTVASRRTRAGSRGRRVHWARTLRDAAHHGGDVMELRRLRRRRAPLPLLLLVDVSGSMERYARLLLAFLHSATNHVHVRGEPTRALRRDVFAFGTELTDLNHAFHRADTDAMLVEAGNAIADFAGGTRLGDCLATVRLQHARRLIGRRTLVLIVSDGLDTGDPQALQHELAWLKRHTRRILWLNPLLRFAGYTPTARGAAVLAEAADAMLAVHNITRLQQLAGAIAALMQHQ